MPSLPAQPAAAKVAVKAKPVAKVRLTANHEFVLLVH